MANQRDIDGLMVDWLYDELSESDRARFASEVEGNPERMAELQALKRTREVLVDLPDEEPPASLSSILLHEAAKQAPKSVGGDDKPGLLASILGWFRPITMYPGLVAVASLVLVAGVAGSLMLRGADKVPTEQLAAVETAPAVADLEASEVALPEPSSVAPAEPVAEPTEERDEDDVAVAPVAQVVSNEQQKDIERARGTATRRSARKKARRAAPTSNGLVSSDERGVENEEQWAQPADKTDALGIATDRQGYSKGGRSVERPWVVEQQAELTQVVRDGRCADAARIANDIREQSPTFYNQNVRDSDEVKKCNYYVAKEAKRRTARRQAVAAKKAQASKRSKAKAGKSSGAGGAPNNAKTAPAKQAPAADSMTLD